MTEWQNDLGNMLNKPEAGKIETDANELNTFFTETALPAYEELTAELQKYGRKTQVRATASSATLSVTFNGDDEISYRLQARTFPNGVRPYAEVRFRERKGLKLISFESMVRSGADEYTISDITKTEVIQNFLGHYKRRVEAG